MNNFSLFALFRAAARLPAGEAFQSMCAGGASPSPYGWTGSVKKASPSGEAVADRRLMRGKYIHLIHRKRSPFPSRGRHAPIGSLRSPLPPTGKHAGGAEEDVGAADRERGGSCLRNGLMVRYEVCGVKSVTANVPRRTTQKGCAAGTPFFLIKFFSPRTS